MKKDFKYFAVIPLFTALLSTSTNCFLYGQAENDSLDLKENFIWNKNVFENNLKGVGVVITDLDGDEKQDVVVAGFGSNIVAWYRNPGIFPASWEKDTVLPTNKQDTAGITIRK